MEIIQGKQNSYGMSVDERDGLLYVYSSGRTRLLATFHPTGNVCEWHQDKSDIEFDVIAIAHQAITKLASIEEEKKPEGVAFNGMPPSVWHASCALHDLIRDLDESSDPARKKFLDTVRNSLALAEAVSKIKPREPEPSSFASTRFTNVNGYFIEALGADGFHNSRAPQPPWVTATEDQMTEFYFRKNPGDKPASRETIAKWYNDQGWYFRPKTW